MRSVFSILIPPLGVFLVRGHSGAFWLNVMLTMLGYLPGIAHTLWVRRQG